MKIAVIIEGSTKNRSQDVFKAVENAGHEAYNLGMKNVEGEPDLTYMETGFLTALLLNLGAVDFVVGGCGTGQGFMNMALQFPGVACGLMIDPVDAFLFSQVNAGNCISLALNKGYGNLAGDLNVGYILEKLWSGEYGAGYPAARREIQIGARRKLADLSRVTHLPMQECVRRIDPSIVQKALRFPGVMEFIRAHAPEGELKQCVTGLVN